MDVEIMKRLTRAVRVADKRFMQTGGPTRRYVIECLAPCLEEEGLTVCPSDTDMARVVELVLEVRNEKH